jgi:DNA-binding Lrp family transcriptional regulator
LTNSQKKYYYNCIFCIIPDLKIMLDSLDAKILYNLDLDSSVPFSKLSKELKVPNETLVFRIKRLRDNGYIKNFITTINVSQLNTFYYKFFFKFHQRSDKIDEEIIAYLKQSPAIAYLANLEGRYDLTFLVVARGIKDLQEFLIPFRARFGSHILEQEILTMTGVHRFNFRFFLPAGGISKHTEYPQELVDPKIKDIDYQIITSVARNSRITDTELGEKLGLHPNVVRYHVTNLKKKKIFGSPVLDLSFAKFGVSQYQVNYSLKNQERISKMINAALAFTQATFATVTLGKYDLALEFVTQNVQELRSIVNELNAAFADDINSHEVFVMQEHSINWYPKRPK